MRILKIGLSVAYIQGGRKKVSHYRESSLNSIKNRQCSYISRQT